MRKARIEARSPARASRRRVRWHVVRALVIALGLWLVLELALRAYVDWPLETDFYGSISRQRVREEQGRVGVAPAVGQGWVHLGWVADPEAERYRVERRGADGAWQQVAEVELGSYLGREAGQYRVSAEPRDGGAPRLVGAAVVAPEPGTAPLFAPRVAGPWQTLFKPGQHGDYVNDHAIFRDARGDWRLLGITAYGRGDYSAERRLASAVSRDFPPASGMREEPPVADFGELAWAPHVVLGGGAYHLFWSPHRLHRMTSPDGVDWQDHRVVLRAPAHRFFRDAAILEVAAGQWLLYATARGAYFSRLDLYQSFDLEGWQYIGAALSTGWGSERASPIASTESPSVVAYRGRYYLTLTYTNDSFFWSPILLRAGVLLDRASYDDTLVFHSDNPYEFGTYGGRANAPSLVARLAAHAPEVVHVPERDAWYVTTAGWPWAASLTSGEVAVAPLRWDPLPAPAPAPAPAT